ncbi:MAG: 2-oxo acid dehydrogenase subunit E2 [Anaerolineae bacterium]|nr:2-oxo acid dehydrogenase subunit E2 [Anaerolineae bacterium]
MAEELFIPKLGQTVETVTLIAWKVEDGAKVEFGQEVLEVETDKAVFPVEANANGYIHLGPYKAGDVLPVLTVVAIIGKQDEKFAVSAAPAVGAEELEKAATEESAPSRAVGAVQPSSLPQAVQEGGREVPFASPRARRLAVEKGVDVRQVSPTGGGGVRVVEKDVVAYLSRQPKATPLARRIAEAEGLDLSALNAGEGVITKTDVLGAVKAGGAVQSAPLPISAEGDVRERIPLKGVRGIIAERMAVSVHTTARVTMFMDADATELVRFRKRLKERYEKEWDFSPGYNELLAKICASALRRYPYMNARLVEDAIEHLAHVNIGIAVDTDRGLLVPVVRDVDAKGLRQIGEEFRQLAERARSGRSQLDDISGGTFTITNLGMYDIDYFTPVINLPEAAILGVGRIVPRPVYIGDELMRREMMTLSLVFDHRLVDGAPAARFLQYIRDLIEEPALLGVL